MTPVSPSRSDRFHPELLSSLRGYALADFTADLTAGVIVGIVALPLAIAFAIASGVAPSQGLITAIVAGFLISALGGSRAQIGGPTGAFVVIVYKIVADYGVGGLMGATLLAGAMLIAMGAMGLGSAIRFVPYPLTVGFTAGISVVIFTSQVKDLLGLQTGPLPADFLDKWRVYFECIGTADGLTIGLSALSLAIIVLWQRVLPRIPGPFVAIVVLSALVRVFHLPVETIGSRFGDLPTRLGMPHLPAVSVSDWSRLLRPAAVIATLAAIESLLSATVADSMLGSRHRSNTELIGQGVANIFSALFGGMPATGAIARTATNIRNGGRTPVAGMVHAATLLLIVLLFGGLARDVPLCVLGAILAVVSYYMSEWHAFVALFRAPRSDVAVLLITFFLTVVVDLVVAMEVGMVLTALLFIKRMSEVSNIKRLDPEDGVSGHPELGTIGKDTVVYEAQGALVFGVVEGLRDVMTFGAKPPKRLVFGMMDVLALDATALKALADLHAVCLRHGTRLVLAGLHSQPHRALKHAGLIDRIGKENVLSCGVREALSRLGASGPA